MTFAEEFRWAIDQQLLTEMNAVRDVFGVRDGIMVAVWPLGPDGDWDSERDPIYIEIPRPVLWDLLKPFAQYVKDQVDAKVSA